ncbi:hypothetical protein EIP91_003505 [Steccherinum ochraceum]|uniref:Threonyl/alanyl tRNA synthetase SAD domain-containing protein n=1 Tax=Steccherinum ochraceum TaxID=92696 RepID=A0A4R0S279_9APHY|nr:hypothetical protein EIP91_003505 [Steccherinum ochraceum]
MAASALVLPPTTPPTYHKIVSETLTIPTDTQKPIPVGLLACQRDPLLRELVSQVISCTLSQSQPLSAAEKRARKGKAEAPKDSLVEVILHDTILFPEGGGQPHDIGLLTTSDGELWDVVDVKRHGGHAVHYVKVKDNNTDAALASFATGTNVGVALGDHGLQRRLDHMCMHTSQHLLSAVLETRLNLPTLSWSMTAYPTPSYVEIPRAMTLEEITLIQEEANRFVFEGRRVHIEVEELDPEGVPEIAKTESGRAVGKGLPTDYTGGVKRTVIIDGVDRNPCCGTHLPSLNNLQLFLLPHMEGLSRAATSSARLYFLSGPRLITYLTSTHNSLTAASLTLSCGAPLVPERVQQVVDDRRKATKRVDDLEKELAENIAAGLVSSVRENQGSSSVSGTYLRRQRIDDSPNPLAFLSLIASEFTTKLAESNIVTPTILLLSSSPSVQTSTSTTVVLVSGSDATTVKEVGDVLKTKLGVKGGGKGTKWSGKFTGVWKVSREGSTVDELGRGLYRAISV